MTGEPDLDFVTMKLPYRLRIYPKKYFVDVGARGARTYIHISAKFSVKFLMSGMKGL